MRAFLLTAIVEYRNTIWSPSGKSSPGKDGGRDRMRYFNFGFYGGGRRCRHRRRHRRYGRCGYGGYGRRYGRRYDP